MKFDNISYMYIASSRRYISCLFFWSYIASVVFGRSMRFLALLYLTRITQGVIQLTRAYTRLFPELVYNHISVFPIY